MSNKGIFGAVSAGVGAVAAVVGAVAGIVVWRRSREVSPDPVRVKKDERRKIWLDPEHAEADDVFRDGEGEGFLE